MSLFAADYRICGFWPILLLWGHFRLFFSISGISHKICYPFVFVHLGLDLKHNTEVGLNHHQPPPKPITTTQNLQRVYLISLAHPQFKIIFCPSPFPPILFTYLDRIGEFAPLSDKLSTLWITYHICLFILVAINTDYVHY